MPLCNCLSSSLPRACLLAFATTVFAAAQGVPHLSVTPRAFQSLVPAGTAVTSAMCQPADAHCLANAVGNPLFQGASGFATDALGNVYTSDSSSDIVVKTSPAGKPLLIAGLYGVNNAFNGVPPLIATAVNSPLAFANAIAIDLVGNIYIADNYENYINGNFYGSILKVDTLGIVTRLTGDPNQGILPADGALASNQVMQPVAIATDLAGNVYFVDANTCTVQKIVPATGRIAVVAGTITTGCGSATSASVGSGQLANTFQFAGIQDVALGTDGTVYLSDGNYASVYSVSPSGVLSLIAGGSSSGAITSGPLASTGAIGAPRRGLAVDADNNIYLTSYGTSTGQDGSVNTGGALIEVTHAPNAQVNIIVPVGNGTFEFDSDLIAGSPAPLAYDDGGIELAFDATGRLIIPSPGGDAANYLDRNGAAFFDTSTGATQQTLTFANTGTGTLTGVGFGGTSLPYALSPTTAQLAGNSVPGVVPFTVDASGTCNLTASFSLAPGSSCTVVLDYDSATNAPNAGSFTLYTNDPLGPATVALAATPLTYSNSIYYLTASTTSLAPSASVSANGSFNISASVISTLYDTNSGSEIAAGATGNLSIGVTNNATGVQTVHTASLTAGTTTGTATATASFSGLAPGTYSLQAVYPGDGTSAANYSPVQTLYVQHGLIDYTTYAVTDYHQPYVGATPQFLNFSSLGYTNPGPIEFQDKFAGNGTVGFTLLDHNSTAVDTTSATPLSAGKYTLMPSVANAASFGYSVTAHPATFFIDPANLTVRGSYVSVPYGQYYVPAGVTLPSGGTALNLPMTIYTAPPVLSTDEAASPGAPNAISLSATIDGQPTNVATMLPVGQYTVRPALSGNGAGNYSLTALTGPVAIRQANLTINAQYTNVRYGQVFGTNYTQSNIIETSAAAAQADVTAGRLTIGTTASGTANSLGYLPVGHYTLTPTISGTGVGNYSLTANRGSLFVQPADLTLEMSSFTTTGSLTVNGQNLCHICYTGPNTDLLTTDPALAFSFQIQGTNGTSYSNTIPYGSSTPVVLGPGTYTVTPMFTGAGPGTQYSLTLHTGTLTVH